MDRITHPGLLAIILFCFCFLASSHAQTTPAQQKSRSKTKVAAEYNELKDETTARIGPFNLWEPPDIATSGEINYERVDLSALFSYRGKRIVKPRVVTIQIFSSSHDNPSFEKRRQLSVLTDTGNHSFGDAELVMINSGRVARTAMGASRLLVREIVRKDIVFDDFADIARSLKVTIKLGDRDFKLSKQQIEACRNFVMLMEQEGLEF